MRELSDHKTNPANDTITVLAVDEPGDGGANHEYLASLPNGQVLLIAFQKGPIAENGVNGLTHEVFLAIVIDRLRSFQAGAYANGYNASALEHCENALNALHNRTRERMSRGVEGTHAKEPFRHRARLVARGFDAPMPPLREKKRLPQQHLRRRRGLRVFY